MALEELVNKTFNFGCEEVEVSLIGCSGLIGG
jgi:hypothetical protein